MIDENNVTKEVSPQMKEVAVQRARERAKNARWDLNIAILLFALLFIVIILSTYTKAGLEVVGPVAVAGLVTVWVFGWSRGKRLYRHFYEEELSRLEQEAKRTPTLKEAIEETIAEKVQKALRERWQ